MTDLDPLLAGMAAHPEWAAVWLNRHRKTPCVVRKGDTWMLTKHPDAVRDWEEHGFNVGMMTGEAFGLAIIDVDHADAFAALVAALGPLAPSPTVVTASGRPHYWMQWEPGIPATLLGLHGEVVTVST
jgi:hypothetical protein